MNFSTRRGIGAWPGNSLLWRRSMHSWKWVLNGALRPPHASRAPARGHGRGKLSVGWGEKALSKET